MQKLLNRSGQIAVILILFVAILLAAFAVIVNIGKISQSKVSSVIAVDTAAAMEASLFASYAENQYQGIIWAIKNDDNPGIVHYNKEEQERPLTRQEKTNLWNYIYGLIIALVGVVLLCTGVMSGPGAILIVTSSLVLSTAALVLQIAVVAPQTSTMWNKMMANLDIQDQFVEQGLQTLLSSSVQDTVLIDDTGDFDMDGVFKGDWTAAGDNEKVGRFSVLYTRRLEALKELDENQQHSRGIVIYGWRDKAKDGQPADSGKWHIVRAEVNVPTRCNNACYRTSCEGGSCYEPYLPWVINWDRGGTNKWYSLIDGVDPKTWTEDSSDHKGQCGVGNGSEGANKLSYKSVAKCFKGGLVRANLMRYDESGGALNWATGVNFWNMRFQNPNTPPSMVTSDNLNQECKTIMEYSKNNNLPPGDNGGTSPYWTGVDGAFLLSDNPNNQYSSCWYAAMHLLNQGMQTQSCAEYFPRHHTGSDNYPTGEPVGFRNSRFGVKFVPCEKSRSWPTPF